MSVAGDQVGWTLNEESAGLNVFVVIETPTILGSETLTEKSTKTSTLFQVGFRHIRKHAISIRQMVTDQVSGRFHWVYESR